jgi:hypothetical protein
MPLNGTGCRFISSNDASDLLYITVAVHPTGDYPGAPGELVSDLLTDALMGDNVKEYIGVVADNAVVGNDNLGSRWSFDPAQGTMGSLRLWEDVGATPTEKPNEAYDGTQDDAVFRVTFLYPKFRTTSA